MDTPPDMLDGAVVLRWVRREEPFYTVREGDVRHPIVAMAICGYASPVARPGSVYLFKCDVDWNVVADVDFDSVEEAVKAAMQWGVGAGDWRP